jgi:hypothetical protein
LRGVSVLSEEMASPSEAEQVIDASALISTIWLD